MNNTNYVSMIVKLLENPSEKRIKKDRKLILVQCRAQFPQARKKKLVQLNFWSKLAVNVMNYYQKNDYILIEGFLSLIEKKQPNQIAKKQKKLKITVFKIYPFFLATKN